MADSPIASPQMIAAAWAAWRVRHPKLRLGPGPGFREALEAALKVYVAEQEGKRP